MRLIIFSVAISLIAITTASPPKKIVCYVGSWSVYRPGNGKFDITGIDPTLCTHLIYSFIGVEGTDVKILDSWSDLPGNLDGFGKFVSLRQKNPSLKLMIAIGGWNAGSAAFSKMASSQKQRATFAENVVEFLKKYQFDGLDIDWEYPAQRGGAKEDVKNYVKLARDLKKAFTQHGYLLSAAVAAAESSASQSYDIAEMSQYLDFINLMEYDFHGYYDGHTGMNAPLSASSSDSGGELKLNIKSSVDYWLKGGAPKEKLILGVPTYGRSFTLSDPSNKGVGAPASAGTAGPYTREAGMLGYNEICEMHKSGGWEIFQDDERAVPYAVKGNQWVSFDDIPAVKAKAEFVKQEGLGGVMVWSLETDDFQGICGEKYPILRALNSALDKETSKNPGTSIPGKKKNKLIKTAPRFVVDSPPKVPKKPNSSRGSRKCTYAGDLLADPNSCGFFTCDDDGRGHFRKIPGICPAGLCFKPDKQYCDWM